jgi:hypothetical protein
VKEQKQVATSRPRLRSEGMAPGGAASADVRWRWSYGRWMADEFSRRYGDLLTGSYDCVDRIVLNAYYPLGHNPGGFRVWRRRLHGDSEEHLDDTHLMRMAGRLARRVKAWGTGHGVPVVFCKAGQRKHRIAEQYLVAHEVAGPGYSLCWWPRPRRRCGR